MRMHTSSADFIIRRRTSRTGNSRLPLKRILAETISVLIFRFHRMAVGKLWRADASYISYTNTSDKAEAPLLSCMTPTCLVAKKHEMKRTLSSARAGGAISVRQQKPVMEKRIVRFFAWRMAVAATCSYAMQIRVPKRPRTNKLSQRVDPPRRILLACETVYTSTAVAN